MDMRLDGRVALVTGSDSSIGQAIAQLFAEHGTDVVVHYHSDPDGAEDTVAEVQKVNRRAVIVQADVGDEVSVERMFEVVDGTFGRVDILVNSAGQGGGGLVHEMATEEWVRVLRTDLYGPFYC